MNTTVNKSLEQRIKDCLQQQNTGRAAAQIVKHIGHCDKKSVNAVLYHLEKQGSVTKKLQGWKPMWSLTNRSRPHGWDGGLQGHPSGQWHGSHRGNHQFQGRHFQAQPLQRRPFQFQQGIPLLTDPVQGRPSQTPPVQGRSFPAQSHGQIPHCNGPPFPNTFQWPRDRGRGRGWGGGRGGAAGRGGDRGRAHRRSKASSSPGFQSSQKTQRKPPEASSNQRGPKSGDEKFKDRASSSTGGTSAGLNGNACMGNVTSRPAPHESVSSSSTAKQADAQQYFMNQMSALNSAVSQTGVESTAHITPRALDTTSAAAKDVNSSGTGGALKDGGSDADTNDSLDLEDDDEMDEDSNAYFETSAFTTRFQDMMGTLTFNDPVVSAEEELMEEEEPGMALSSSDFIVRLLSVAPDQAMTLTELAEVLMKSEEELASVLAECGDKVDVRDGKCSLTANGKMWAEVRPESCQCVESDSEPKPEQGSSLMPAGPISPSISGPPKPPKEWIQSQTAPVTKNETSTTHSGVPAEGRPAIDSDPSTFLLPLMRVRSFGRGHDLLAFVDSKPPPGQAGRGGFTVSGSPPAQAGRGGFTVSGSPPGQAGRGGITVSGSHDVREVESNYFSTATSQASPATSSTVTSAAAEKTGQSSSHADPTFLTVDEIPWKPLMSSPETPVNRNVQSSVLFPSSQSSPAGQTSQGPMARCSDMSEMPQLFSPHKSSSSGVVPVASSDVVPYTFLPDSGAVNSLSAQAECPWMGQSPNSLHPRLQKFAAEGLTFVPASMSSVCSAEKTSTCPASSGTFQKPLTPKELIELETPWRGAKSQPSGSPQSSSVLPPTRSSPSLPHSRSAPIISSVGPTSLPAWGGSEEELAGPATLQITSESFAALNKNPISALMEYAQSRHATATIEMVSQRGPSHRPVFVMAAKVGNRLFTRITCHNKKDGKKEAADVALRTLIAEGQLCPATPSPSDNIASEDMTHFDKMAALTHQAFNLLIASIPENLAGRKVIAGLVMKRNPQDLGIVVSLGTGNRCITGDKLSLEGNTVNDSHAEIITRRGFMRFLYQELLKYEEGKAHDLFERGAGGKLRVKNGVTFHLYISTAPCGDGALFSPRDTQSNSGAIADADRREHCPTFTSNVQGLLRTKMEGGEGTIPVDSKDVTMQTWDGVVRGERLRTMSCTDKICRWNVLGLQGALLSHFLEPVYLDSLTLGFLYDHGHLSRAVCCRLAREEPRLEQELSPGFRLNHPWLGRVTACQPLRETQKTKAFSINWVIGDPAPEVLDGTVGLCYTAVEKKLFSRLTKRTLYDSFLQVAQHLGRSDLCQATSYHQAKMAATAFQTSKAAMFRKFQQMGCGWVKKPLEEEMFS